MLWLFLLPAFVLLGVLAYTTPGRAVVLLSALLPFYLVRFSVFGLPSNLFEMSVMLVFVVCALQEKSREGWSRAWRGLPFWLVLLTGLFSLGAVMGALVSAHTRNSLGILKGWVLIPLLFGWLVYVFSLNKGFGYILKLIKALVFSGVVVSVIGLFQSGSAGRISSIYEVSNSLALFIVPLISLALVMYSADYDKKFFSLSLAVMMFALVGTKSFMGVGVVLAVSFLFWLVRSFWQDSGKMNSARFVWWLVFFLVLSSVVLFYSGRVGYLLDPFLEASNGRYNSISVRWQLWDVGWELVWDNPLWGVGLGEFEPNYQRKLHERYIKYQECAGLGKDCDRPIPEFVYRDPHNIFLSFWLNTGLAGLVGFVMLNVTLLMKAIVAIKKNNFNDSRIVIVAVALALTSILIYGCADTVYWKNDLAALYWFLVGLLLVALNKVGADCSQDYPGRESDNYSKYG